MSGWARLALVLVALLALVLRLLALVVGACALLAEGLARVGEAADRQVGSVFGVAPVAGRIEAAFIGSARERAR